MRLNPFRRSSIHTAPTKRRKAPARRRPRVQHLESRLALAAQDLITLLQTDLQNGTTGQVTPGEVTLSSGGNVLIDIGSPTLTFDGSGGVTISASDASLFPGNTSHITATLSSLSGSYSASNGLSISAGVDIKLGGILDVKADSASFQRDSSGTWTINVGNASATSPDFPEVPSASVSGLAITDTGVSFTKADLSDNSLALGGLLTVSNFDLDVTNFSYTAGGAVAGDFAIGAPGNTTATLFPNQTFFSATVSDLHGNYDLTTHDLSLSADVQANWGTGNAAVLNATATGIAFTLDPTTDDFSLDVPSATATSPKLGSISGTVTNLKADQTGLTFDSASLTLPSVNLDNIVKVQNLKLAASNFDYSVGQGLSGGTFAITADSASLFQDQSAPFSANVTGFGGSYDVGTGQLDLSASKVDIALSNVLTIDAQTLTFQLDPLTITIGSASATSPRFGVDATIDDLAITSDGFSFSDATLGPIASVNVGDVFTFSNLSVSLTNFGYSISHGASFGVFVPNQNNDGDGDGDGTGDDDGDGDGAGVFQDSVFTVTADKTSLNIGSAFDASATGINGSVDLSSDAFSFKADSVAVKVGPTAARLELDASTVQFDPDATGATDIADFGSLDAKLTVGSGASAVSIDGSAQNFGISSAGDFVTQPGFGVSFTVGASDSSDVSDGVDWPKWLPIQISHLSINWDNFATDPTDFIIDLSASVNTTFGSVSVNGFVDDAVIDTKLLDEGKFPLIGLGGVGIQAGGTMFGATIRGQLFLSMLQEDANHNVIPDGNPQGVTVASSVLYGGIDAAIDLEGEAGFEVRLGVSQLGPLQAYVSVADPVILEPISGLALTDFAAGINFDSTLPSITDPRQMANDPEFTPTSQLTLEQWKSELETAVKNQTTVAAGGGDIWNQLTQPMTLEGSVTLFDAHATEGAFKLTGDFKFDTVGHFFAQGDLVMGGTLNLPVDLYFNASDLGQGAGSILVLARAPGPPATPLMTVYGGLTFDFGTQPVNTVATLTPVDPQLGAALQLNGTSQYAKANNIDLNNKSFTVEFWAQRQDSGRTETVISQSSGLQIGFDGSDLTASYGGTSILSFTITKPDKLWHEYAFSFDSTSGAVALYVDGVEVASGTTSQTNLGATDNTLYIGNQGGSGGYFAGAIDEVRVWDVVRAASDIAGNMNAPISDQATLQQMLGYWRFDEGSGINAADSSGHSDNATLVANPSWIAASVATSYPVDSQLGAALALNGTSQDATAQNIDLDNKSFTIEFWAQRQDSGRAQTVISQTNGLQIGFDATDNLTVTYGGTTILSYATTPDQLWHDYAFSFDSTSGAVALYVDGVEVKSGTASQTSLGGTDNTLYIGSQAGGGGFFDGAIDEVRVWDVVRSASDISGNMNAPISDQATLQQMLGYWRFDEGSGTTAADSSLNATTAQPNGDAVTLVGSPQWIEPGASSLPSATISSFNVSIFGGIDMTAASVGGVYITGTATFSIATNMSAIDMTVTGSMGLDSVGSVLNVNGAADLVLGGATPEFWGALEVTPGDLSSLSKLGIDVTGTAIVQFNTDSSQKSITLPDGTAVNLPAASLQLYVNGSADFKRNGNDWFQIQGTLAASFAVSSSTTADALQLNGTSQYVTAPNINLNNTSFTVELWAQRQDSGRAQTLVSESNGLALGFDAQDNLTVNYDGTNIITYATQPNQLWHDYAVSFDGSTAILYVDGVQVGSGTMSAGTAGTTLYLGSDAGGNSGYFDGSIDDVRVWNVARSASDIADNMDAPLTDSTLLSQMLGYWRFDDGSGATAADSSPQGNAAQLVGNPQWIVDKGNPLQMTTDTFTLDTLVDGTLSIGPAASPYATFGVNGFMQIADSGPDAGIAAEMDVTLNGSNLGSSSVSVSANFFMELNTTGKKITYTIPAGFPVPAESTKGAITIPAGPTDASGNEGAPGPYLVINGNGSVTIDGNYQLQGKFDLLVSSTVVSADFDADLTLGTLGTLTATGSIDVSSAGVVGVLSMTGNLGGNGFTINNANLQLAVNTTGSNENVTGFTVDPTTGNVTTNQQIALAPCTVEVIVGGDLSLTNNFDVKGEVDLTESSGSVQAVIDASVNAGSIGTLTFAGSLNVSSAGVVGVAGLSLSSSKSLSASGFSINNADFQLAVNTTINQASVTGFTVDPSTGDITPNQSFKLDAGAVEVIAAGDLSFTSSFEVKGEFDFAESAGSWTIGAHAAVKVPDLGTLNLGGSLTVDSTGLFGYLSIGTGTQDLTPGSGFSLSGTFALEANTHAPGGASETVNGDNLTPGTVEVKASNANLTAGGFDVSADEFFVRLSSGSVMVSLTNGSVTVGSLGTVTVGGNLTIVDLNGTSAGVYGELTASVAASLAPVGGNFSISGTTEIQLNTTDAQQTVTVGGQQDNLDADTVRVHVVGSAQLQNSGSNSFLISGTLDLTAQPTFVSVAVTDATVSLGSLGNVSVSGDLNAGSAGMWGDLAIGAHTLPNASGFSIFADMQLEANTTGKNQTALVQPIDPTTGDLGSATETTLYANTIEVAVGGSITFTSSFTVAGEFDLTMSNAGVHATLNANVSIFNVPLTVSGSVDVRGAGTSDPGSIDGTLSVTAGGGNTLKLAGGAFTISAGATFTFDTQSDSASFSLHAPNGDVNSSATVSFLGISASGNLTMTYNDGLAKISVPDLAISVPDFVQRAGAALMKKLTLGTTEKPFDDSAVSTIHVGGFLQSDGQFMLTVSGGTAPTSTQTYNMNGSTGGDGGFALTIGNFTGSVTTGYNVSASGSSYTVSPQTSDSESTFTGFSAAVWAIGWAPVVGHATVAGGVTIASNQFAFNLSANIDGSGVNLNFSTANPSSSGWTTPPVIQSFSPSGQFGPTTRVFSPPAGSIAKLGPPILDVDQGTTVAPSISAYVPGGTVTQWVAGKGFQTVDQHPLVFSDQVFDPNGNLVSSSQPQSAANDQFTAPSFTPEVPGNYKVVVTATDTASGLSTSQTGYLLVSDVPPAGASISMPSSSPLGQSVTASVSYPINLPAVRAGETYTDSWTVSQHGNVVASGTSSTSNSFTFTPPAAGNYNVAVVVSDNYGGSTTVNEPLSVVDPTAGLSFAASGSTPQNKSVTFVVTGGGPGVSYSYDLLNNGKFEVSNSTNASISQAFSQPGTYVAHVRVSAPFGTNPDGIVSDYYTAPFVITDVAPQITDLNLRGSGTVGGSLAANIFYTSKNKTTVSWTVSPDTFTQFNNNGTNINFIPQELGVYSVTAEVADQYGGTATMTKRMVVSPANAPLALNNDGPDAQNSAATVFFTGNGTGLTYSFDFLNDGTFSDPGDVANSSTPYATYTFTTPGQHIVHGQIKSSTGTVTDYDTTVTVLDVPVTDVGIAMPSSVYLGQSMTANGSYTNPTTNQETVAWTATSSNGTQVATGSGQNFTFTFKSAGTYTVSEVVSDLYGGSASQTASLTVIDPTAGLTFAGTGPLNEGSLSTVAFSGADPNADLKYSFDFLNNGDLVNSVGASASHKFTEEGTYVVHGRVSAPGNVHTDYYTTLTVLDPAVQLQPVAVQGTEGVATGLVAVATFTDPGGAEKVSDYSATINWGDGNTTTGTVVANGSGFSVKGNHTYANADAYALNVTVNHDQAPAATAQSAATIAVVPLAVSNLADDNVPPTPAGSGITLRDAVNTFNAKGGLNEIDLGAGTYTLTQATIASAPVGTSGSLVVGNEDLTIKGAGAGQTIIDASALGDRVFDVLASGGLHLIGVTITGGDSTKDATGNGSIGADGGGIRNQGTLTLDHVDVKGNKAVAGGGVESFDANTAISNSTIEVNSATVGGGLSGASGSIQIINSSFSDNKATTGAAIDHFGGQFSATGDSFTNNGATNGGAIYFDALAGDSNPNTITASTFSGNFAAQSGGAIDNATSNGLALTDSTLAANQAGAGGAINNSGSLLLTSDTFSGNLSSTAVGGAVANTPSGATQMIDSIVAQGSAVDLSGTINASYSLIQKPPAGGLTADSQTLLNVNPLLAPLGNYGGPTQTMPLLPGSPAIDAGTSSGAPTTDQRGQPRQVGGAVDMGAFESSGFTLAATSGDHQSAPHNAAFAGPLVVTVTPVNSAEPVAGGQISWSAPSSGASAALSSGTAAIAADGTAKVTATTNSVVGSYQVTANTTGAGQPARFNLTNVDTAPVIASAGPYIVGTEGALTLSAKVFDPDPGQTITVSWDLNGDGTPDAVATATSNGSTVNVQASLSNASVASLGLFNGLGMLTDGFHVVSSKQFTVSVTASDGILSSSPATATLISEIGPEGGLKNNGPVVPGESVTAQVFVPDGISVPGPLRYSIAQNPNDLADTYADASTDNTQSFTFDTPGSYTVYGRLFQADGAFSDYTDTIDVYASDDQNSYFVDEVYNDLFHRSGNPAGPDGSGGNHWVSQLVAGASHQEVALAIMSDAGGEYDAQVVKAAFQQYLHRDAEPQAVGYFTALMQTGLTAEGLDIDLVSSDEYLNNRGGGTNDGFLDALYEDALGRTPDPAGLSTFNAMLAAGASRAQVADMVFGSTEYQQDLVNNMFESLLDRPAEPTALAYFAGELASGMTDQQVMAQIIGSEEFAPLA